MYSFPTIVGENFISHLTFLFWKEITKTKKKEGSSNHFLPKKNSNEKTQKVQTLIPKKLGKNAKDANFYPLYTMGLQSSGNAHNHKNLAYGLQL
jgi:hypothetical protein